MATENESQLPVCVRCGRPVRRNLPNYQTFEQMHWACFHYEGAWSRTSGRHDLAAAAQPHLHEAR
jgi:hypothetical protein